jgi:hypothetical protein
MVSQTQHQNREAVRAAIIEPMTRLYQPPVHLRTDKDAFNAVLEEYQAKLCGFHRATLEKAWAAVKEEHETWIWPHLKVIRDACIRFAPADRIADTPGRRPWEEKDEAARKLAADYLQQFELSALMRQAKAEGWDGQLRLYAEGAARAQACLISGQRSFGYLRIAYQWEAQATHDAIARRRGAFEEAVRRQAATGQLAVDVPNEAIECWQKMAAKPVTPCAATPT